MDFLFPLAFDIVYPKKNKNELVQDSHKTVVQVCKQSTISSDQQSNYVKEKSA